MSLVFRLLQEVVLRFDVVRASTPEGSDLRREVREKADGLESVRGALLSTSPRKFQKRGLLTLVCQEGCEQPLTLPADGSR